MATLAYPSTLVLIGVNLIPLWLALTGRWDGFDVLLAFWWEGLIVAAMALLKVTVARERNADIAEATFNVFDLSLGGYLLVVIISSGLYLWLIGSLAVSFDGSINSLTGLWVTPPGQAFGWAWGEVFQRGLLFFAIAQIIPHVYSFVTDYLRRAEYQRVHELFESAVIRIGVIDLTTLVFVLISLGVSWFPLWIVVAIKILVDGTLHLIERMSANPSDRSTSNLGIGP